MIKIEHLHVNWFMVGFSLHKHYEEISKTKHLPDCFGLWFEHNGWLDPYLSPIAIPARIESSLHQDAPCAGTQPSIETVAHHAPAFSNIALYPEHLKKNIKCETCETPYIAFIAILLAVNYNGAIWVYILFKLNFCNFVLSSVKFWTYMEW